MEEEFTFTGTGPIITAYDWAFRYLCIFLGDMINFKQDAPLSDQLEQFHQENGYFKRQDFYRFYGDLIKSKNLSDFNKSLQAFSEMKPIIGTGYTTAIELCDKDLISQALIGKNSETHEKEQPQGKISTEKEKRYSLYDMPCCFLRQSLRSEKPQTIEETTSTTLGSVRK